MSDMYIAPEVIVPVFGHEFRAYRTEEGELVYSLHSSVEGTSIPITTFRRYLTGNIPPKALKQLEQYEGIMKQQLIQAIEILKASNHSGKQKLKAKVGDSVTLVTGINEQELLAGITIAAASGNTYCQAIQNKVLSFNFDTANTFPFYSFKPAKTDKLSTKQIERICSNNLAKALSGKREVVTTAGRIDVLTSTEIIEVKEIRGWKNALGQILIYGYYYPSHNKRIHLFGETQEKYLEMIKIHYGKYGVAMTWEA